MLNATEVFAKFITHEENGADGHGDFFSFFVF